MTLHGQPNADPSTMDFISESYIGSTCHQEVFTVFQHANVTASNDVSKTYSVNLYSIELRFSAFSAAIYNCTQQIVPGQLYDVT